MPLPRKPSRGGRQPLVPGGMAMFQDPGPRAKALVQKHGPATVLRAMRDEKFMDANFTTYDAMIIAGLANSINGSGEERERMFNRMFGKVPDKTINLNLNIDITPDQLSAKASALLAQLDQE